MPLVINGLGVDICTQQKLQEEEEATQQQKREEGYEQLGQKGHSESNLMQNNYHRSVMQTICACSYSYMYAN